MSNPSPFPDTIRDVVQNAVISQEEIENGWIFTLAGTLPFEVLQEFVRHELECCSFLNFSIDTSTDALQCKVIQDTSFSHDIKTVKEIILALFS